MAVTEPEKNPEDEVLAREYSFFGLAGFFLPAVFTYIFIALYQMVDGYFIGQYVGAQAISSVNLYYPVVCLLICLGTMMGSGANAAIVKALGEGRTEKACSLLSQVLTFAVVLSMVLSAVLVLGKESIMSFLGASEGNIAYLRPYYLIISISSVAVIMQTLVGLMLIGEGRTVTAAILVVIGGVLNCVLDWLFMAVFGMGIVGAAIATVLGYLIPIFYLFFFYSAKGASRYRPKITMPNWKELGEMCFNGSSDMIANLAAGITTLVMNHLVFDFYQEMGVSVATVRSYAQYFGIAIFMGMTTAVEPLFSYHYGDGNSALNRRLLKQTLGWTMVFSVMSAAVMGIYAENIVGFFFSPAGEEKAFFDLAVYSVYFVVPAVLFAGFNIFVTGLFTAFSNGTISALLSIVRSFILLLICMFSMSSLFGADGLWASWAVTEAASFLVSLLFLLRYRKRYKLAD